MNFISGFKIPPKLSHHHLVKKNWLSRTFMKLNFILNSTRGKTRANISISKCHTISFIFVVNKMDFISILLKFD